MTAPFPQAFLKLPADIQRQIVETQAATLGRTAEVLYKDVWVVWTLQQLFTLPDAPKMVFKGGTSLSKVFQVISRFSEDIDVTVDFQHLKPEMDLMDSKISKNERDRRVDSLKKSLQSFAQKQLIPHFEIAAQSEGLSDVSFTFDPDEGLDANIHVGFPNLGTSPPAYLRDHVLLELGTRNPLGPSTIHTIHADLAEFIPGLVFPQAPVMVMDIERTYWEKLTLIHNAVTKGIVRENSSRLSRHWYDVARIHQSAYGAGALKSTNILHEVVSHKTLFFTRGKSVYNNCLNQGWRLVPDELGLGTLQQDYENMQTVMFYGEHLDFTEMVSVLRSLQDTLNGTPLETPAPASSEPVSPAGN